MSEFFAKNEQQLIHVNKQNLSNIKACSTWSCNCITVSHGINMHTIEVELATGVYVELYNDV